MTSVLLIVSLLPFLVFTLSSYYYIEKMMERSSASRFQTLANTKAEHLEEYYINNRNIGVAMARNPIVKQALKEYTETFDKHGHFSEQFRLTDEKYREYLTFLQHHNNFYDLFLISERGDIVFSVRRGSDFSTNLISGVYKSSLFGEAFRHSQFLLGPQVSRFGDYGPSAGKAAFVVTPMFETTGQSHIRGISGAVASQLNIDTIYALTSDYRELGSSGEIVVVAENNGLPELVTPLRHSTPELFRIDFELNTKKGFPAKLALKGQSGFGVEQDYRDVESIAVWNYLPYSGLGMVVKIDKAEIYDDVTRLQRWLLGGLVFIGCTIIYFADKYSKSLAVPIVRLAEASRSFSEGKSIGKLPISSVDEIDYLTESFNVMRQSIETSKQSQLDINLALERGVNERTAELEKALEKIKISQEGNIQAEKMASLGILTAGVGHEINNPLMGILNYVEYAEKHSTDDKVKKILVKAMAAVLRIKAIVTNMMTYSHETTGKMETISVQSLIENVVALLREDFSSRGITMEQDIPESLPFVRANSNEIFQCLLNILLNARDVVTGQVEKKIRITVHTRDEFICIDIRDTGSGVTNEVREKMFDPFFTTKSIGKGTGLGLSVSTSLVEKNEGKLTEESNGSGGALFRIQLNKS